ncbi:MAG: Uncharacterised protein [Cellulomonadaceae bacterium TMED98]|nr:MAG: Uncharacterised protein [Cellulomonadaceae bacterium TMED98]
MRACSPITSPFQVTWSPRCQRASPTTRQHVCQWRVKPPGWRWNHKMFSPIRSWWSAPRWAVWDTSCASCFWKKEHRCWERRVLRTTSIWTTSESSRSTTTEIYKRTSKKSRTMACITCLTSLVTRPSKQRWRWMCLAPISTPFPAMARNMACPRSAGKASIRRSSANWPAALPQATSSSPFGCCPWMRSSRPISN